MLRVCLKCERVIPHGDELFERCTECGANEWAVVPEPSEVAFNYNDYHLLLKRLGIAQE